MITLTLIIIFTISATILYFLIKNYQESKKEFARTNDMYIVAVTYLPSIIMIYISISISSIIFLVLSHVYNISNKITELTFYV